MNRLIYQLKRLMKIIIILVIGFVAWSLFAAEAGTNLKSIKVVHETYYIYEVLNNVKGKTIATEVSIHDEYEVCQWLTENYNDAAIAEGHSEFYVCTSMKYGQEIKPK